MEREKKVFAGPRVRQLRLAMGLTQTGMAEALGVSGSYLNLVERNQRPLTTQLLLRLAEVYDLDLRDLRGDQQARVAAEMTEALTDPVFGGRMPTAGAIVEVASGQPDLAAAFLALYGAYRKAVTPAVETGGEADRQMPPAAEPFPIEEVRDQFHRRHNYIEEVDDAAEALHGRLSHTDDLFAALRDHLREKHQVKVIVMPVEAMPEAQRRFDAGGRRLMLSEMLPMASRVFQSGVQIALLSEAATLDRLVAAAPFKTEDARRLYRIGLANHFAGALMMPYGRFIDAAEAVRFDIDVLASRFGASIEQVAHRLATLQRRDRKGVPFFLLRLDNAGNISKRFAAGGFHFARFGGTCPRWRVYDAFATPGQTIVQPVELPDGTRYLTISRTVETLRGPYPNAGRKLAISLGCEVAHAHRVVYGDGLDLSGMQSVTPIGVTCRMCERSNCSSRAFPPMTRSLTIDADRKGFSAFEFG
ncbi:helix-turn-helix domain-containing protein [Zavarzinia compransoris]|uniref:XRE family transcriptional regulator n=1 Tax=Zavarzinia compransoris TaxID=1264899 RepID=A0A317DU82_9PROT|nr:XRE family transcriptional regulator [Zavarzinia compransoris]PWR18247.1 XRE family transcriptional regulator [Zavarzinia compransoris]TDP40859.1 Xre family transcriptional regulator [Zavarzinia compransoris]